MTRPTAAKSEMLVSQVKPRQSYLRAANLELHHDQSEHYIPTGRALEVLRRLVHSVQDPAAGRAWSLTGPYGAGKSSFALFLHTLLGPASARRSIAEKALADADSPLLSELQKARVELGAERHGFLLATTTCQLEPLTDSLIRALQMGVAARWRTAMPKGVKDALELAERVGSARALSGAVRELSKHAPVLLVLDEFGKTLEHFAGSASRGGEATADLFVLQELAELATGQHAAPVFIFTLQHLAFDDYVRQASAAQRREWGKVQGRFEDVPFLETAEQSLRLVAGALDDSAMTPALRRRRANWSSEAYARAAEVGLGSHLPGAAETLARCYPLHPAALLALPELCARLGQHGRTLFSFLASTEGNTAQAFLARTPTPGPKAAMPFLALSDLYDFFAGPGQALAAGVGGSRWREIHERVREANDLPEEDLRALKTVGLLNLMGSAAGLRASAALVAYALSAPDKAGGSVWKAKLTDLESRGWLTYRAFADEYRLWQGSDVDLRGRVADAREQLRSTSPAELLTRLQTSTPLIAGKHSQRVGMLRYFTVGFCDEGTAELPVLAYDEPADGSLIYYLGSPEALGSVRASGGGRPIVVVSSTSARRVRDAAIEAAAALAVLDHQEVVDDRVAKRELQDRVADARQRLSQALANSFRPGEPGVVFQLASPKGLGDPLPSQRGLSRLLSEVCDQAYGQSPEIRNEMLGRRELTSQGSKARRNLIQAMLLSESSEKLDLPGYGPERAMYEAVLRHTGLHRQLDDGDWHFTKPLGGRTLTSVWGAIAQTVDGVGDGAVSVDKLYRRLMAPPIGLKEGPIPVLLTAFLLHRDDDVAIYEDGTYQPALSADVLERLMKTPQRFALKAFNTAGSKGRVLGAVNAATDTLTAQEPARLTAKSLRNGTVLAVAAPLLNLVRSLPEYTRYTGALTPRTLAVRAALLQAREPDTLLLEDLPRACDVSGLSRTRGIADKDLEAFEKRLRAALAELQSAYLKRLEKIGSALAAELSLTDDIAKLRITLRVRSEALEGKVLDPKLKAFLFTATDESPSDSNWLESMGLVIADRPSELWRDEDAARFEGNLGLIIASFRRVEALHFDSAARTREGFVARRLTLTTPEGYESSRVMYYDEATAHGLKAIAESALNDAVSKAGPQGRDALIALMADMAMGSAQAGTELTPAPRASSERKAKRG